MNKLPFEKIFDQLKNVLLSDTEKAHIRSKVAHYAHTRPVATPVFWVRRLGVLALSLVVIVSTSSVLTYASQDSLPGDFFYPIKRSTEVIKKTTISSPTQKIAYELSLLEKRFQEVNILAEKKLLTKETETIANQAITQQTESLKNSITKITATHPTESLIYSYNLSSVLKTGSSIILAISEKNSNQKASHTPDRIVLAAYEKADIVSNNIKKIETLMTLENPEKMAQKAEEKYAQAKNVLAKHLEEQKTITSIPKEIAETKPQEIAIAMMSAKELDTQEKNTEEVIVSESDKNSETQTVTPSVEQNPALVVNKKNLETFVKDLEDAYTKKDFPLIITTAEKIIQEITDTEKIKKSEKEYNIVVTEPTLMKEKKTITPTN